MKNRFASVILFLLAIPTPALAQESRPRTPRAITIDDFFQIRDVSQPEISPDGQWIAYAVRTRMLKDRKSTRLNSSHGYISYAVFCLKKKREGHAHLLPHRGRLR